MAGQREEIKDVYSSPLSDQFFHNSIAPKLGDLKKNCSEMSMDSFEALYSWKGRLGGFDNWPFFVCRLVQMQYVALSICKTQWYRLSGPHKMLVWAYAYTWCNSIVICAKYNSGRVRTPSERPWNSNIFIFISLYSRRNMLQMAYRVCQAFHSNTGRFLPLRGCAPLLRKHNNELVSPAKFL